MGKLEENQSPLVDKIKAFITKTSQITGLSEVIVGRVFFGAFILLCAMPIYARFTSDNDLQCDSLQATTLVRQIAKGTGLNGYLDEIIRGKKILENAKPDDNFAKIAQSFLSADTMLVSAIRTTKKDSAYKRFECAAQLNLRVSGITPQTIDIKYTLERTSDGQLFATVYGLY